MVVRALVLCISVVMTWVEIPPLSSPMDFFLLMSQNPGLLVKWQTVSFLCVTSLREESINEIIDSVSKWKRREDSESHRSPEKTTTKYRRKAGYREKKSRQQSPSRAPAFSPEWRWLMEKPRILLKRQWQLYPWSKPLTKLSQASHPVADLGAVGSSLMNGLLVQRMPSFRLCNLEGSCLVFDYWRLSYLESLRPGNKGRQVAWIKWAIGHTVVEKGRAKDCPNKESGLDEEVPDSTSGSLRQISTEKDHGSW